MQANELMIGDWVYNTHNKQNEQVEEVGGNCVMLAYNDLYAFDEIEPIPLTPGILEKNGWESMKNGSGNFILTKPMVGNSATITKTINGYEMSHGAFNGLGIHYIHQLQHALRLCGIEKEIGL